MFETKKILTTKFCGIFAIGSAFLIFGCFAKSNVAVIPPNNLAVAAPTPVTKSIPAATKTVSKIKFSSVYTKLDNKTCQPVRDAESEQDEVPDICDGYKDYKIFVSYHGTATQIFIGREITKNAEDWDTSTLPQFIANGAGNGQVVEWRLADGEPFACIVRAQYNKKIINPDEEGEVNELVVKNLNGFAPIDIVIDATKNKLANEEARKQADAAYGKP